MRSQLAANPEASSINAATRSAALQRLSSERFDVLVVGGGVTGAGVALDAASRGLKTALIERVDLAAGTSRWSSKLIHGGLRYFAKAQFRTAYESALERHLLLTRIAPHLVRPMMNLVPDGGLLINCSAGAALILADGMRRFARTPSQLLPAPRWVAAREVAALTPALRPGTKALIYSDGKLEDDARLVVNLARTAAAYGAKIVTRCSAQVLGQDRLELTDELTGESFEARGQVILAAGVWSGELDERIKVVPSRGSHLVLRTPALARTSVQLSAPVPGSLGRRVFTLPSHDGLTLLGLTDELDPAADPLAPTVPDGDQQYLLQTMNSILNQPLTSADVVGKFAGLRPLVAPRHLAVSGTDDISRRHLLLANPDAPIVITGGKLTTYRQMAQDAVDAVSSRLGKAVPPCRTRELPLLGAASAQQLAQVAAPDHLVRRYGTLATEVWELARTDPKLAEPVTPNTKTIAAEFVYAVRHEAAFSPADLLERRTRLSFVAAEAETARPAATAALESVNG